MTSWIFIMTGTIEDFTERITNGKWPIYKLTQNRFKIKKNDNIVFYLAGPNNGKILGNAKLSSNVKKESKNGDGDIEISDVDLWKNPVLVKDNVESLDFVKNKNNWGAYFQGGVKSLDTKGYKQILNLNLN